MGKPSLDSMTRQGSWRPALLWYWWGRDQLAQEADVVSWPWGECRETQVAGQGQSGCQCLRAQTCMHWSVQRQAGFIWLLLCCQPCPGLRFSGQSLTCMTSVYALPPRGLGFHWWFLAKHMPLNPVHLCNLSIIWAWEHPSQLSRYWFKHPWKETWLSYLLASQLHFSQVTNPWPTTLLMKTPCSTSRGAHGPELPGAVSHCMMVCSCFRWLCCGWFNIHEGTPHGELRLTTLHNCCLWTK